VRACVFKIEEKLKKLETSLNEKSNELLRVTEERNKLLEKLELEKKEKENNLFHLTRTFRRVPARIVLLGP